MVDIKLNFLHICENAFLSIDKKISIIGVFNKILANSFPAIHPILFIITNVSGKDGTYLETIEIIAPDETVIAKAENNIVVESNAHANFIARFVNLIFPVEGRYKIKISINGERLSDENDLIVRLR